MENQKAKQFYDLKIAYYTGCFAQVTKPHEFYETIIEGIDKKPQSGEEMFGFLKNLASLPNPDLAFSSGFKIPLKLTPDFDGAITSYIYRTKAREEKLFLPDVSLSLDGQLLSPTDGTYTIKPGLIKIRYANQVFSIVIIRDGG